jgi:hypothetical protein
MTLVEIIDYLYPGMVSQGLVQVGIDNGVYHINKWEVPNVPEPSVQELLDWGAAHELEVQIATLTLQAGIEIQVLIDTTAQSRTYADGVAASSYANSSNVIWKAEAEAFILWRDSVWVYAYTELPKFASGERPLIPIEQFMQELPQMQWPD